MANNNIVFDGTPATMNGDLVVGYTDAKSFRADFGHLDSSTLKRWYEEDPLKNHLGLVELFSNIERNPVPMYLGALKDGGVIEVNGIGGTFSYDLPVSKSSVLMTMEDTSSKHKKHGVGGGIFEIVLNRRMDPGITLTYDAIDGEQVVVASEWEPQSVGGSSWRHFVRLASMNGKNHFPADKLRAGVSYFVVGQNINEFSTKFASPYGMDKASTVTCQFQLGNHRGVESSTTMYAGMKRMDRADEQTRSFVDKAIERMNRLGEISGNKLEYAIIGKLGRTNSGKIGFDTRTAFVASTIELFCLSYLSQLEYRQLMFQRAAVIEDGQSVLRLNEGYVHQIRRGYTITYGRKGGITREHIKTAVDYIFRNSDLDYVKRRVRFKAGPKAYDNVFNGIFRDEFYAQLARINPLFPSQSVATINNPVSFKDGKYFMNPVVIGGVFLPGIGVVELELDSSLGYQDFTDRSQFVDGMTPRTSFSLIIENITDQASSNAFASVPHGTAKLGNLNQNVFYVKPEGASLFWGSESGRWSPSSAQDIASSMKQMAHGFWCHSSSACWVRDTSRYVTIELRG